MTDHHSILVAPSHDFKERVPSVEYLVRRSSMEPASEGRFVPPVPSPQPGTLPDQVCCHHLWQQPSTHCHHPLDCRTSPDQESSVSKDLSNGDAHGQGSDMGEEVDGEMEVD